jgi:hypothetical protein
VGLHDFVVADEQPQLPSDLMRSQAARRLAAVLLQDEQLAEFNWLAVPIGALKDIDHRRHSTPIQNWER